MAPLCREYKRSSVSLRTEATNAKTFHIHHIIRRLLSQLSLMKDYCDSSDFHADYAKLQTNRSRSNELMTRSRPLIIFICCSRIVVVIVCLLLRCNVGSGLSDLAVSSRHFGAKMQLPTWLQSSLRLHDSVD